MIRPRVARPPGGMPQPGLAKHALGAQRRAHLAATEAWRGCGPRGPGGPPRKHARGARKCGRCRPRQHRRHARVKLPMWLSLVHVVLLRWNGLVVERCQGQYLLHAPGLGRRVLQGRSPWGLRKGAGSRCWRQRQLRWRPASEVIARQPSLHRDLVDLKLELGKGSAKRRPSAASRHSWCSFTGVHALAGCRLLPEGVGWPGSTWARGGWSGCLNWAGLTRCFGGLSSRKNFAGSSQMVAG